MTKKDEANPLRQLADTYMQRGADSVLDKISLLGKIRAKRLSSATAVAKYHDILLFLLAFPDDVRVHALATAELDRVAGTVDDSHRADGALAGRLADSGIAHSTIDYAFSAPLARWLSDTFPADIDLAWDDESVTTMLEQYGHLFVCHAEQDSLLTHRHELRELFEMFKGASRKTVLAWLLDRFDKLALPHKAAIELFNLLSPTLHWQLDKPLASRTFIRLPRRRLSRRPARRPATPDLDKHVAKQLPPPVELSRSDAQQLIDVARATLCVRHRETESVSYPNPAEVTQYHLGGGIDVVIYGMSPDQRLPTESFFGLLAASNGVPIAYGGGFVYRDRLDLGLNIFKEFRGGDSAFVYAQILRAFCQHFDSRHVVIDSAQFGYGRPGGIASGAFWFYYKLGFRPADPALARLAEAEMQNIIEKPSYRSSRSTLRRYTQSDLWFTRSGTPADSRPPAMSDIGLAISRQVAKRFDGDRDAAATWAQSHVRRALGASDLRPWPAAERRAFLRMCQLVSLIPDLADWSVSDKRALIALMRAKGGEKERVYVQRLSRHTRFANALETIAAARSQSGPTELTPWTG